MTIWGINKWMENFSIFPSLLVISAFQVKINLSEKIQKIESNLPQHPTVEGHTHLLEELRLRPTEVKEDS